MAERDPAEEAAIRSQVEGALRTMTISMVIGLVVIAVLAVLVSSLRGVLLLAGIIYLFGSLATQWYLRRRFLGPLKG
jgi:ABC-type bacteriocin/lantibiotic exporter with double-glycine peptidase domain